ncbi:MAG: cobalamin receptor [Gammaproteobacteria bacterium]|nr:MAG: cobalamin receptor [Gammaproteobacteria bacterium]
MKHSQGNSALRTSIPFTLTAIAASMISFSSIAAAEQLDTVTVTANRMASDNVLAATTVITRDDIERLQITDLSSLLSRQVGIDFTTNGGIGKTSSLFIRGTSSDHVLFLVDGVKWYSATSGGSAIQHFPVEQIERIEIVRGSRSGLYGSEAIGGVIQIFTRKGQQGMTPYAKVAYGTHASKQVAAGISGGNDTTKYNFSVNHQSTDGIDLGRDLNKDNDGYENTSFSANVEHDFTKNVTVGINITRAESDNEYDDFGTTNIMEGEATQQILGSHLSWNVNDIWTLSAQINESRDQSESFKNSSSDGIYNTRRRSMSVINTLSLNDSHIVNLGWDYENDHIASNATYAETSRDNKAVFISLQSQLDKASWLLSGRHDNNEAFGTHNTGTAEWGYQLHDNLQITANYGTAFKAPSFNSLYYPGGSGNPLVKPEESKSWGFGFNGVESNFDWAFNFYNTKIINLIEWAPISPGSWTYVPSNVASAEIKGVEFEINTTLFGADISADASFLSPEDSSNGTTLQRRAKRLANLHIDKQWNAWSAGASWKLRGQSFNKKNNIDPLGGFSIVDLRTAYKVNQDWLVQASINNLFDKEYQTVKGYNSLDRTAMLTLSYSPK